MFPSIFLLATTLLFLTTYSSNATSTFDDWYEKQLVSDLLTSYGPTSVRPVKNHSKACEVFFRLLPKELIGFDEAKQQLVILHFMRMMWIDENLTWDPNDYGGVNITTVKPSDVWRPDISLYENAQKEFINVQETYIMVSSDGLMDWYFPAIVTSLCKVDITYFPYDVQDCNVSFGPWSTTKHMVYFQLSHASDTTMDIFNRNGVWTLERSVGSNHDAIMCCDNRTWSLIRYDLTLRRESMFYTKTVVVPAFLLTLLMAFVCWLHPASGEKVTLAVSNLLALILFQQLVADRMPPSGETTSILANSSTFSVNFFNVMIAMCCAEVLCTIFVLRIYHMDGQTELPWLLIRIMLCPIILPLYTKKESKEVMRKQHANYRKRRRTKSGHKSNKTEEHLSSNLNMDSPRVPIGEANMPDPTSNSLLGDHGHDGEQENNVCYLQQKARPDDLQQDGTDPEMIAETWRETAIVIDKLIFILLLLVTAGYWIYLITAFCHAGAN